MIALRLAAVLETGTAGPMSAADARAAAAVVAGTTWPDVALMARFEAATGTPLWRPSDGGVTAPAPPAVNSPVRLADVFELTGRCVEGLVAAAEALGVRVPMLVRMAGEGSVLAFGAFGQAWLPKWHTGAGPGVGVVLRALPRRLPAVTVDRWMTLGEVRSARSGASTPLEWLRSGGDPGVAAAAASAATDRYGW